MMTGKETKRYRFRRISPIYFPSSAVGSIICECSLSLDVIYGCIGIHYTWWLVLDYREILGDVDPLIALGLTVCRNFLFGRVSSLFCYFHQKHAMLRLAGKRVFYSSIYPSIRGEMETCMTLNCSVEAKHVTIARSTDPKVRINGVAYLVALSSKNGVTPAISAILQKMWSYSSKHNSKLEGEQRCTQTNLLYWTGSLPLCPYYILFLEKKHEKHLRPPTSHRQLASPATKQNLITAIRQARSSKEIKQDRRWVLHMETTGCRASHISTILKRYWAPKLPNDTVWI